MKNKQVRKSQSRPKSSQPAPFPVVGIGASAGGLDAFRELLHALPVKTGMAFVLVQHLDPAHKSILPDLLAKATRLPVAEARDDEVVKADHVYVIPPNTDLTLADGVLKIEPRTESHGRHLAIDSFFRSLAETHKSRTIGVLLSGTASDGTLGLKAIKAEGGITFAQDEQSAAFSDMPRNAIAAGVVDFVLAPKEIARQLVRLGRHLSVNVAKTEKPKGPAEPGEAELALILAALRERTGVDFTHYKATTLERRIERRMVLHKLDGLANYRKYLEATPGEAKALYQDLLINVTGFFRDPTAYQALKRRVLPQIVRKNPAGEPLRAWVVGCSTGEEAYSIAICLLEYLKAKSIDAPIQIFGTDLDETAVAHARIGLYPKSALQDVSPDRLQRFFTSVGDKYQIRAEVREKCTFAPHDVTSDPPFSRLDLISCRNVFIYMQPVLQKRILAAFHYALKPKGFLLLGATETIDASTDLFALLDKRNKIYARKTRAGHMPLDLGRPAGARKPAPDAPQTDATAQVDAAAIAADRILLAQHVPASVVVDDALEIVQFRGSTGPYLEPAAGKASFNLLHMARPGLALDLRAAIRQARKNRLPVRREGVSFQTDGELSRVNLEVVPLKGGAVSETDRPNEPYYLVLFEPAAAPVPRGESEAAAPHRKSDTRRAQNQDLRIKRLELELAATKGDMQATIERVEATNEELRAANEEVLSSNEELQTLNEELESSKEELQSTNEELTTLNQELQTRNEQLKEARDYAEAIVRTIREPLLILGGDLRVRSANDSFYGTFKVLSPEEIVGAFIYDLEGGHWNIPALRALLGEVLQKNQVMQDFEVEADLPSIGHKVMLLNARRVDGVANQEGLILLAIEDITERRELEQRKDEFIARTAHELRTPVTTVQGYADLLTQRLEQGSDDQARLYGAKLDAQLRHLTILITDLLDISRMQAGKLQLEREELSISALAQEVIQDTQAIAPARRIVFEGGTRKKVWGDRHRICQVLANLLANALKFSPPETEILVRTAAARGGVKVSVQDSGIGISKEDQARLFQRFFQAEDPNKRKLGGMGLGLYISAAIVERHGGKIWAESQKGKGSTFTFFLPDK